MKLVEIADNMHTACSNIPRIDDDSYLKPRVLSTLDSVMSEILRAPISDGDKWTLYSQSLQKYLNHAKVTTKKPDCNFSYSPNNKETIPVDEETFNFSLGSISEAPRLDMSVISPIRDSIDSISQPTVRNFFERARVLNTSNPSPEKTGNVATAYVPRKKKRAIRRLQPSRAKKRRPETSLSADMSRIRPCKVTMQRLNWEPTNAR